MASSSTEREGAYTASSGTAAIASNSTISEQKESAAEKPTPEEATRSDAPRENEEPEEPVRWGDQDWVPLDDDDDDDDGGLAVSAASFRPKREPKPVDAEARKRIKQWHEREKKRKTKADEWLEKRRLKKQLKRQKPGDPQAKRIAQQLKSLEKGRAKKKKGEKTKHKAGNGRNTECPQCGRYFKNERHLADHTKAKHG